MGKIRIHQYWNKSFFVLLACNLALRLVSANLLNCLRRFPLLILEGLELCKDFMVRT